jgi:transposase
MAMGRRKKRVRQEGLWTPTAALPVGASHPFYRRLNQILDEKKFDEYVETICEDFYAGEVGRPGLSPGIYFGLLMVGYFEVIDSERGIAWRASDSLSIRSFVRIGLDESVPDHSTISRTRRLMDVETHQVVFQWVLQVLAEKKLLKGTTIGVDATTLEANAALRSIVRRDTGERYEEFLMRLAKESGIETPTREPLAKLDRKRPKKGSNYDWTHPHDPDARITKMKDWAHTSSSQGRACGGYGEDTQRSLSNSPCWNPYFLRRLNFDGFDCNFADGADCSAILLENGKSARKAPRARPEWAIRREITPFSGPPGLWAFRPS